jgi:protein-tyrosine phosphatase
MAKAGVNGVLNVQTEIDFEHRGIHWPKMLEYYRANKITAIHYPIHDFNEADLKLKLKAGADLLNKMINEDNLEVYVHCTAGMGRAPAIVVTYLCLYKGMDPDEADLYVK